MFLKVMLKKGLIRIKRVLVRHVNRFEEEKLVRTRNSEGKKQFFKTSGQITVQMVDLTRADNFTNTYLEIVISK